MPLLEAIHGMVDALAVADDATIGAAEAKLDDLRRLTSGADREVVLWALALAVRQSAENRTGE